MFQPKGLPWPDCYVKYVRLKTLKCYTVHRRYLTFSCHHWLCSERTWVWWYGNKLMMIPGILQNWWGPWPTSCIEKTDWLSRLTDRLASWSTSRWGGCTWPLERFLKCHRKPSSGVTPSEKRTISCGSHASLGGDGGCGFVMARTFVRKCVRYLPFNLIIRFRGSVMVSFTMT